MSAYFTSGFSVRQPMWHGAGFVAEDYPESWEQARKWADMEWEAASRPVLVLRSGLELVVSPTMLKVKDADGKERKLVESDLQSAEEYQGITRDDTDEVLSVKSKDYGLIHIATMGEILETVLGQPNVKFETAGVLHGGRYVWALAYLDEPYQIPGDINPDGSKAMTLPFLALLNSFDGTYACQVVPTQIRVVCWNTYSAAMAQGERSGLSFKFHHFGDVEGRIKEAGLALATVREDQARWLAQATELATLNVSDRSVARFTELLIPSPEDRGVKITDRVAENIKLARSVFTGIYNDSATVESHRGRALGLVNAATEYLDHSRGGKSEATMLGRSILRPEPLKAKCVAWAKELADEPTAKPTRAPAKKAATRTRTPRAAKS